MLQPMQHLTVRICYPVPEGAGIVLRTSLDEWKTARQPDEVEEGVYTFSVTGADDFFYFKPCLVVPDGGEEGLYSQGMNYLATARGPERITIFPFFYTEPHGHFHPHHDFNSEQQEDRQHRIVVYTPPGYNENTLRHYPVVYMHDGQNLFFPEEAFAGVTWNVASTMELLDATNVLDKHIVVGVYSGDRMHDFCHPGCEEYGRFMVEEVKTWVDANFRTVPEEASVVGSSLGGLVSLYLAWNWPDVFSKCACLSSTFGHDPELVKRVARDRRPKLKIYLDSGWPGDNFEATRAMFDLLLSRGYQAGRDVQYLVFPTSKHNEADWANRLHIPFQFLFTKYAEFGEQDDRLQERALSLVS